MKKIIKNKYFWVIFILLLIYIPIVIIVINNERKKEASNGYLILSNIASFSCNLEECISVENEKILENNKEFTIFEDGKNIGIYKADYVNNWMFFDINNKWQEISSRFIAGSEGLKLNIKEETSREMTINEENELKKILAKNNISNYSSLNQNLVLEYDLDKDNKRDRVIIASNISDETTDKNVFSVVFSIIKNKVEVISIDTATNSESYKVPTYNFLGIINLYNQKEDYIIINKGYFSEEGKPSCEIYKVDNKKLTSIITKD